MVAPNVRGSSGYGRTYEHLDDVELRMDSVRDLAAGGVAGAASGAGPGLQAFMPQLHEAFERANNPGLDNRRNAIAPGPIDTPLLRRAPAEMGDLGQRVVDVMVGSTVLRRLGSTDEVAAVVAFLCSEDSSYVTGQSSATPSSVRTRKSDGCRRG